MHHAGASSLLSVVTSAMIHHEKHSEVFTLQQSDTSSRVRIFNRRLSSLLFLLLLASGEAFSVPALPTRTRSLSDNSRRTANSRAQTQLQMFLLSDLVGGYNDMLEKHPLVTASITAGCLSGLGDAMAQVQQQQQQQLPKYVNQSLVGSSESTLPFANHCKLVSIDLERLLRFILKGLGGGLIWLAWYHLADDLTQRLCCFAESTGGSGDAVMTMGGGIDGNTVSTIVTSNMVFRTLFSILLDQFLASPFVISIWEIPMPILLTPVDDHDGTTTTNNNKFQRIRTEVRGKLGLLLVENAKVWTVANIIIYNLPFEYRVLASSCTDVVWQSILSRNVNDASAMPTTSTKDATEDLVFSSSSTVVGLDYALQQDLEAVLLPSSTSSSGSSTMEEEIAAVV